MTNRCVVLVTFRDNAQKYGEYVRWPAGMLKILWMKALKRREDEGVVELMLKTRVHQSTAPWHRPKEKGDGT